MSLFKILGDSCKARLPHWYPGEYIFVENDQIKRSWPSQLVKKELYQLAYSEMMRCDWQVEAE